MKTILLSFILVLLGLNLYCQHIIQSDTEITRTIKVNDSINLQFLDWPSPGISWNLYSDYDTTFISINEKSTSLVEYNFPKGGKCIKTMQYTGKSPGEVKLDYYWGRLWLKEMIYHCRIEIFIK